MDCELYVYKSLHKHQGLTTTWVSSSSNAVCTPWYCSMDISSLLFFYSYIMQLCEGVSSHHTYLGFLHKWILSKIYTLWQPILCLNKIEIAYWPIDECRSLQLLCNHGLLFWFCLQVFCAWERLRYALIVTANWLYSRLIEVCRKCMMEI